MTPIYEVHTKHTKQVLKDFIRFSVRINSPSVMFRLSIFALCFYTIAYILRNTSIVAVVITRILGTLLLGFALFRNQISFMKLAKEDKDYQQQSEIKMIFGHAEFIIYDANHPQGVHVQYGEVSQLYGDDTNFYIGVNNETLHVVPKRDLVQGSPEKFYDFLQNQTGKQIMPTVIPWKTRIAMMSQYRDQQYEIRQAKAEEEKKKKQERKNKK